MFSMNQISWIIWLWLFSLYKNNNNVSKSQVDDLWIYNSEYAMTNNRLHHHWTEFTFRSIRLGFRFSSTTGMRHSMSCRQRVKQIDFDSQLSSQHAKAIYLLTKPLVQLKWCKHERSSEFQKYFQSYNKPQVQLNWHVIEEYIKV